MDVAVHGATDSGTAGVIARPPLMFLIALVVGFVADHLLPLSFAVPRAGIVHQLSAGLLILAGLAIAVAGIRNFARAGTPVRTFERTRALVTTGIHGRSRNPIYLGMFLCYIGIGLAVHSEWTILLLLLLAALIRQGVVAREEAYLERRFGSAYRDYRARVRRWV
jgi:protein-S-isoprenylcysteine O-methyltransferase Ste14